MNSVAGRRVAPRGWPSASAACTCVPPRIWFWGRVPALRVDFLGADTLLGSRALQSLFMLLWRAVESAHRLSLPVELLSTTPARAPKADLANSPLAVYVLGLKCASSESGCRVRQGFKILEVR